MKKFIEKLIDNIEKRKKIILSQDIIDAEDEAMVLAYNETINIINTIAEKYKGDWIPCSERLPDEATTYEVTKEIVINSKKQYIVDHCLFGTEGEWICSPKETVIAWMPLPEPYCNKDN